MRLPQGSTKGSNAGTLLSPHVEAPALRSSANNLAECRELRRDVFTSLIGGYTDSRVASYIPKIHRSRVKHARGGTEEEAATLARVQ